MADAWAPYVNSIAPEFAQYAAIYGLNGQLWTSSQGFPLKPEEAVALVNGLVSGNLQTTGVRVNGEKLMVLRAEDGKVMAQKGPKEFLFASKCKQCVLVGYYNNETSNPKDKYSQGNCVKGVEKIADYLKDNGY